MRISHCPASPKVSVVIPAHSADVALEKCLSAIAKSRIRPIEVIVADQTEGDEIKRACDRSGMKIIKIVKVHNSNGAAQTRNHGAHLSTGDFLVFIDSDVEILRDTIANLIKCLDRSCGIVAAFGRYSEYTPIRNFASVYKNLYHSFIHQSSAGFVRSFWTGCGAVFRDVFLAIGGFDENYGFCGVEDIEFGWRLNEKGFKIVLCNDVKVFHWKERTFWKMVWFDISKTAFRWTRLILKRSALCNQLNTTPSAFVSLCVSYGFVFFMLLSVFSIQQKFFLIGLAFFIIIIGCNWSFFKFVRRWEGRSMLIKSIFMFIFFNIYAGLGLMMGVFSLASLLFNSRRT